VEGRDGGGDGGDLGVIAGLLFEVGDLGLTCEMDW
jgi:hypothetical protein